MMKQLAQNIWTVEGSSVTFAGASMNTRMTIVKLSDETLWLHSPILLTAQVSSYIDELGGQVSALVAPNKFHYLFLDDWIATYPQATLYADVNVQNKVESLAQAEVLTNDPPSSYSDDIDQVVFAGNKIFQEVVFYHRESGTLILTDLMVNLRAEQQKFLPRWFLKFEQVAFPNGGVPRLYRWFTSDRMQAKKALTKILDWSPQRLTFCHGEPFTEDASTVIQREFSWLLK